MGKMFNNVRAKWNDISDKMSDPGKLAQLSVYDLEKGIQKAKDAAAPVIGTPIILHKQLEELKLSDSELTVKIKKLIATGEEGKISAKKYIERQVEVRNSITKSEVDYVNAKETADMWHDKIRTLENELFTRRKDADNLEAKYATAKAEQNLSKHMKNIDSLSSSSSFNSLESKVNKEQAKAYGMSQLSGLNDKINEEKIFKNSEVDALLDEYMNDN
jgi:phage shock protein A